MSEVRPDEVLEALREVMDAREDYAKCHMAEENAIRNYSGDQSAYSRKTIKATKRLSKADKAARAILARTAVRAPSQETTDGKLQDRLDSAHQPDVHASSKPAEGPDRQALEEIRKVEARVRAPAAVAPRCTCLTNQLGPDYCEVHSP